MRADPVRLAQDARGVAQLALIRGPQRRFVHVAAAYRDDRERRHRAEDQRRAPQPARVLGGQREIQPEHDQEAHGRRRVPHRAPRGEPRRLVAAPAEFRELGQERHRDRQIDADAEPHHEARGDQHLYVRRESGHDRGDDEAEHVGHEHAVAADLVGEPAAEQAAEDRADHDRRADEPAQRRRQAELAGHVLDAVRQRGQIVRIEEHAAEREQDDHARVVRARARCVDEARNVARGADRRRDRRVEIECAHGKLFGWGGSDGKSQLYEAGP
ncbi:hypothetical protein BMAFMH_E0353 [Burkholderia mallei FMH]|nr:hypothetical protein BMAFMH_E0353 [Burkholderia mallei FMH]